MCYKLRLFLLSSRPVQPTSSSTNVKTRSGSPLCRPPTQAPPPQPSRPMTSPPAEIGAQKRVQQRPTSPWKRTELVLLWVRTRLLLGLSWLVPMLPLAGQRASLLGRKRCRPFPSASVSHDVPSETSACVFIAFFSGWRLLHPVLP